MRNKPKPTKEEAIATLSRLGLVDKLGELTERGKRVWQAMNIPNKYNKKEQ